MRYRHLHSSNCLAEVAKTSNQNGNGCTQILGRRATGATCISIYHNPGNKKINRSNPNNIAARFAAPSPSGSLYENRGETPIKDEGARVTTKMPREAPATAASVVFVLTWTKPSQENCKKEQWCLEGRFVRVSCSLEPRSPLVELVGLLAG